MTMTVQLRKDKRTAAILTHVHVEMQLRAVDENDVIALPMKVLSVPCTI